MFEHINTIRQANPQASTGSSKKGKCTCSRCHREGVAVSSKEGLCNTCATAMGVLPLMTTPTTML